MPLIPEPDSHGWMDFHCSRCYRPIRSKKTTVIGMRCRECDGPIRPGTASQYERWLASRPPAQVIPRKGIF